MKNEKLPSELVKSYLANKKNQDASLQDTFIEMIIHESILINKRTQLEQQIDQALDERNKPLFLKLSSEMNELIKMFGT
ncbi:IDEAL domain-containing protein [Peribacillus sp. JNUCC 23]|uniref:IDEAL domain-containing protein n=1 Tax=Peribacillus sp. NPDC096379 TaxID=3364393 RepID=UPI0038236615